MSPFKQDTVHPSDPPVVGFIRQSGKSLEAGVRKIHFDDPDVRFRVDREINADLIVVFDLAGMVANLIAEPNEPFFDMLSRCPGVAQRSLHRMFKRRDIASGAADIGDDARWTRHFRIHPEVLPPAMLIAHHHDPQIESPAVYLRERDGFLNDIPLGERFFLDPLVEGNHGSVFNRSPSL